MKKKFIIHYYRINLVQMLGAISTTAACGTKAKSLTMHRSLVTCNNCKRTKAYKRAR